MRLLLQDLCERRRGHRNVSDEELELAMAQMDLDGNGDVSVEEFTAFFTTTALSNVNVTSIRAPRPGASRDADFGGDIGAHGGLSADAEASFGLFAPDEADDDDTPENPAWDEPVTDEEQTLFASFA